MVEVYAGLDVSEKMTHVCVADGSGIVVWSGARATDPDVIAWTLSPVRWGSRGWVWRPGRCRPSSITA